MASVHDRLQQLLDGELDPSEIIDDPTLVSLADRLYGIKIAAVQPVKPRDAFPPQPTGTPAADPLPATDLLVEVIGVAPGAAPSIPLPDMPEPTLELPPVPTKTSSPLTWVLGGGLLVCVGNLFGLFSSLFESMCSSTGADACRGPEQTRLNLMDAYKIGESDGWSYSLLSESMNGVGGVAGGIGIPDLVAILVLLGGLILLRRR